MGLIEIVKDIIWDNQTCHIATSSLDGKPDCSIINYASTGCTLYFETKEDPNYRKYRNLISNPRADIAIAKLPFYALQMEGRVNLLEGQSSNVAAKLLTLKLKKTPRFYLDSNIRFFEFVPTRVRLMDGRDKPVFHEIKIF